MACEVSTRGHPCSRFAKHTLTILEDGIVFQRRCCAQHRERAMRQLVASRPTHFSHDSSVPRHQQIASGDRINTIVTVDEHLQGGPSDVPETERHYHFGNVVFGPETERQHFESLYERYQDEYCRIGMFGLQNEDPEWKLKYEECIHHMRMIEFRLDWLP